MHTDDKENQMTRRRFIALTGTGLAGVAVAGCCPDTLDEFLPMTISPGAEYDVIVVGSGGPGLSAALAAKANGAKVLLLEATSTIGGTSICSGGQVWIPNNHHMRNAGISDSREEALDYLRTVSPNRGGPHDEARWAAFVDNGPKMIRFLEERTPLRFQANDSPDYFADLKGGKSTGRALEARPFAPGGVGKDLRYPPEINRTNIPLTWEETSELIHDISIREIIKLAPRVIYRYLTGKLANSRALIAGLYAGCVQNGVEVALLARAKELLISNREVSGIRFDYPGRSVEVRARGGVILATGGFEWNPELKKKYLRGRIDYPASIPSNRGDGLLMASQAGAKLAHMDEAMYWPGIRDPEYFYEGVPLGSLISNLRSFPHTIVVNRAGRRFGNEAAGNFGYEMQVVDSSTGQLVNLPCWAVFDAQFLNYGAPEAGIWPNKDVPSLVKRFDSLEALASHVGIDRKVLLETVKRFNAGVREGKDPEFQRGEASHDRCYGAADIPHPNLGAVEKPPFYCTELIATALGTKGGPMTSPRWEVLHEDGAPIGGLYAIGNVSDAISDRSISGGSQLGPGLTAGYLAGNAAAIRASRSASAGLWGRARGSDRCGTPERLSPGTREMI